jgi:hypothetical protein
MTTRRGLDFEYAIKKDVRNNPIVREIDEERQRQLWRTATRCSGSNASVRARRK